MLYRIIYLYIDFIEYCVTLKHCRQDENVAAGHDRFTLDIVGIVSN